MAWAWSCETPAATLCSTARVHKIGRGKYLIKCSNQSCSVTVFTRRHDGPTALAAVAAAPASLGPRMYGAERTRVLRI
jgi:hypothetical protein